jgi:hypothetical protein
MIASRASLVSDVLTRLGLVRRALRVALCYVIALQAILAAYGTALAVSAAAPPSLIVCHNAGSEAPADTGARGVPCALCATAASATGLPTAGGPTIAGLQFFSHRIQPLEVLAGVTTPIARAGLARAPPQFA